MGDVLAGLKIPEDIGIEHWKHITSVLIGQKWARPMAIVPTALQHFAVSQPVTPAWSPAELAGCPYTGSCTAFLGQRMPQGWTRSKKAGGGLSVIGDNVTIGGKRTLPFPPPALLVFSHCPPLNCSV